MKELSELQAGSAITSAAASPGGASAAEHPVKLKLREFTLPPRAEAGEPEAGR